MDALLLLALFVGITSAGVTQVIAGVGVRLVIPPLAILVAGHAEGLRIALTLGLLISLVMFVGERRNVPVRAFTALGLPIVLSAPVWVFLVGFLPHAVAARLAGLVAVGAVVVTVLGVRTGKLVGRTGTIGAGLGASGVFALGGVGGPVLGVYARDNHWSAEQARAVVNAGIALAQVMVLGFLGLPNPLEPGLSVGLIALAVGLLLGGLATSRLPKLTATKARTAATFLAATAAVALLVLGTL